MMVGVVCFQWVLVRLLQNLHHLTLVLHMYIHTYIHTYIYIYTIYTYKYKSYHIIYIYRCMVSHLQTQMPNVPLLFRKAAAPLMPTGRRLRWARRQLGNSRALRLPRFLPRVGPHPDIQLANHHWQAVIVLSYATYMCMYMYICMYVYLFVYIYIYVYE